MDARVTTGHHPADARRLHLVLIAFAATLGLGVVATLVLATTSHAMSVTKPPGQKTVEKTATLPPNEGATLQALCPRGYSLAWWGTWSAPVVRTEDIKVFADGVRVTFVNLLSFGGPIDISVSVHCVKKKVKVKDGTKKLIASLVSPKVKLDMLDLPSSNSGFVDFFCKPRTPIGWGGAANPELVEKVLRAIDFDEKGILAFRLGNPFGMTQSLDLSAICLERRARVKAKGRAIPGSKAAAAAKKVKAKPKIRQATQRHTIPPHPGGVGSTEISAKCKKNFAVTSYGWDARDNGSLAAFLQGPPEFTKRKVSIGVTNQSPQAHTVSLSAVCLAMKFKGL